MKVMRAPVITGTLKVWTKTENLSDLAILNYSHYGNRDCSEQSGYFDMHLIKPGILYLRDYINSLFLVHDLTIDIL